jgi:hypothetical protein
MLLVSSLDRNLAPRALGHDYSLAMGRYGYPVLFRGLGLFYTLRHAMINEPYCKIALN